MKNRAWAWKITGTIVVVLMSWALLVMVTGVQRLKKAKATLRAQGESLNWRDIVANVPGGDSNGEHDFLAAIDGLAKQPGGMFSECFTAYGERIPLALCPPIPTEIKEYTSSRTIRRWSTNVWVETEPFLQMGADNWDFAKRAATNDTIMLTLNWSAGAHLRLPHLSAQKTLFAWIRMAVLNDLREGNGAAALDKIITGYRLLEIYHEPIMISVLVERSCGYLLAGAVWEMWTHDGWTDAQLARLQQSVDAMRIEDAADRALQMERSLVVTEWGRTLRDPSALKSRWASSTSAWELTLANTPIWRMFVSNADLAWYLENSRRELEAYRVGYRARSKAAHDAAFAKTSGAMPRNYLFSRRFGVHAKGFGEKVLRSENHRELMVTAIALKRFRLKQGRYPEKLAELMPGFLADAPVDWMDGKELRYERLNDDQFRLWSVGNNGIDDGGDPLVPGSKTDMNPEHGRDWVWPQVSAPADIEAFIKSRETEMKKAKKP